MDYVAVIDNNIGFGSINFDFMIPKIDSYIFGVVLFCFLF